MLNPEPGKAPPNEQPPPYQPEPSQPTGSGMYPPPAQPQGVVTTTVYTQPVPVVYNPLMYGPNPLNVTCPHCQATVVTSTSYESGVLTWLLCGGIALVGCFWGCCLIPFCINDVQDCRHTCPNCKNFLGVYRRI